MGKEIELFSEWSLKKKTKFLLEAEAQYPTKTKETGKKHNKHKKIPLSKTTTPALGEKFGPSWRTLEDPSRSRNVYPRGQYGTVLAGRVRNDIEGHRGFGNQRWKISRGPDRTQSHGARKETRAKTTLKDFTGRREKAPARQGGGERKKNRGANRKKNSHSNRSRRRFIQKRGKEKIAGSENFPSMHVSHKEEKKREGGRKILKEVPMSIYR